MEYESWQSGLSVILPVDKAKECGVHMSKKSWAPKRGKKKGRNVVNATVVASASGPSVPLNTPWVKEASKDKWGDINHPSLAMIVRIILEMEAEFGRDALVLFKMDIKGAFTQVWIRPQDCHLLGAGMRFGLVHILIAGMFGLTEMPFVFEVITRVIRVLLWFGLVKGAAAMYVDDIIGVSTVDAVEADLDVCHNAMCILARMQRQWINVRPRWVRLDRSDRWWPSGG
jgi:hypothetical protein